MTAFTEDLEKEIALLRELLDNIALEERCLLNKSFTAILEIRKNRIKIRKSLSKQRKKRRTFVIDDPGDLFFLEQISTLETKIQQQTRENQKMKKYTSFPQPEIEQDPPIPPKKTLLLDEESNTEQV